MKKSVVVATVGMGIAVAVGVGTQTHADTLHMINANEGHIYKNSQLFTDMKYVNDDISENFNGDYVKYDVKSSNPKVVKPTVKQSNGDVSFKTSKKGHATITVHMYSVNQKKGTDAAAYFADDSIVGAFNYKKDYNHDGKVTPLVKHTHKFSVKFIGKQAVVNKAKAEAAYQKSNKKHFLKVGTDIKAGTYTVSQTPFNGYVPDQFYFSVTDAKTFEWKDVNSNHKTYKIQLKKGQYIKLYDGLFLK
jgi:hypothetical protein